MSGAEVSLAQLVRSCMAALATVFVLVALASTLAKRGVLPLVFLSSLSKLTVLVLTPSMFFTFFGGLLSLEAFGETWPLLLAGMLSMLFNLLLAVTVLDWIGRPSKSFRPWFILAVTFPNLLAIPLVFVFALCEQSVIRANGELRGPWGSGNLTAEPAELEMLDEQTCQRRGEFYLMVFLLVPTFVLFTCSSILKQSAPGAGAGAGASAADASAAAPVTVQADDKHLGLEAGGPTESLEILVRDGTPAVAGQGMAPEKSAGLGELGELALCDRGEDNGDSVMVTSFASTECFSSEGSTSPRLVAASAAPPAPAAAAPATTAGRPSARRMAWNALTQPPVVALVGSIALSLVAPLQEYVYRPDSVFVPIVSAAAILARAVPAMVNLNVGGMLGLKIARTPWSEMMGTKRPGADGSISRRTLITLVLGKLVLVPALSFPLIYLAQPYLPDNHLMLTVIYFEQVVPSANLTIILATFFKCREEAETLSLAVVWMYALGMFTMTGFSFLAMVLSTA